MKPELYISVTYTRNKYFKIKTTLFEIFENQILINTIFLFYKAVFTDIYQFRDCLYFYGRCISKSGNMKGNNRIQIYYYKPKYPKNYHNFTPWRHKRYLIFQGLKPNKKMLVLFIKPTFILWYNKVGEYPIWTVFFIGI